MYLKDLTPASFHGESNVGGSWHSPILAVGYIEHPHEYTVGQATTEVINKLELIANLAHVRYNLLAYFGVYFCSYCAEAKPSDRPRGLPQVDIIIPGQNCIYISPGGISHYMLHHSYMPPKEYIDAVLCCPEYGTHQFIEALTSSNRGYKPPLQPYNKERAALLAGISWYKA